MTDGNPRTAEVEIDNAVALVGVKELERCVAQHRQVVLEGQINGGLKEHEIEARERHIDMLKDLIGRLEDAVEQTDKQMEPDLDGGE